MFGQEVTVKRASQLPLVAEVRDMKVSLVYDIRPQITTGGSANYLALYVGMTVIYVKNQNVAIYFKIRELMDIHHRVRFHPKPNPLKRRFIFVPEIFTQIQ